MMFRHLVLGLMMALAISVSAAEAAPTIVNLNASSTNPNAGHNSGTYAYNPVTVSLAAGTYSISIIGTAQGGLYDAYSVATPPTGNYTNAGWSVSLNNATAAFTQASIGRYDNAAASLAAYSSLAPYTFTLVAAQSVQFFIDDVVYPYFGDNTGGISLSVAQVPEPGTVGLLGLGIVGVALAMRRRGMVAAG